MPRREVCSDKSGTAKGKNNVLPREILLFVSVETNTAVMLCDEQHEVSRRHSTYRKYYLREGLNWIYQEAVTRHSIMWSHSKMKPISTSQWAIPQVKLMATKNDKHGRRRQEDESWWPQLRWWSKSALQQIWIKPYEEWRKIKDAQVSINST